MIRPLMCILAAGSLAFSVGCGEVVVDKAGNTVEEEVPAANLATATQGLAHRVVICAGGNAPVRYWNPSSCGGTVQDYYPQGWHGWYETGGGCFPPGGNDYYFHPDNGAHGGWIESWRLCSY
jgi:hypothetical protein